MQKRLSKRELDRLVELIKRLTPDEQRLLLASRDQIAALPPDKQRELGRQVAKFIHQRGTN